VPSSFRNGREVVVKLIDVLGRQQLALGALVSRLRAALALELGLGASLRARSADRLRAAYRSCPNCARSDRINAATCLVSIRDARVLRRDARVLRR